MQHAANTSEQSGPVAIGPLFTLGGPTQASDPHGRDRGDIQAKEYEVAKSRLSDLKFNISKILLHPSIHASYSLPIRSRMQGR